MTSTVSPNLQDRRDISTRQDSCIAVVVLNWNQKADTLECLDSLRQVHTHSFKVILVDNGSVDGSPDACEAQFPEIDVIRNSENLGYADGNNVGIRRALESGAQFVLLLNNDTVVHPDFLDELLQAAYTCSHGGIFGAKVVYYSRPDLLWALGGTLQRPLARFKMHGRDEPAKDVSSALSEFDHVPGAVMLVRAEVFRQVGLLGSEFFLNWEDAEFCIRAQKAGWKIVAVPGSVVRHKVSRATAGKIATYFGQRNRLLFARKCLPRWQVTAFVVPFHIMRLVAFVAVALLRGRPDLAKAASLGTLDFFRGRLGKGSMAQVQTF